MSDTYTVQQILNRVYDEYNGTIAANTFTATSANTNPTNYTEQGVWNRVVSGFGDSIRFTKLS